MAIHRRYLTYSLRSFFVILTILAAWLALVVNRAQEQRDAVKAIEALNGSVRYDWQPHAVRSNGSAMLAAPEGALPGIGGGSIGPWYDPLEAAQAKPGGPEWLRRLFGDDCFQEVDRVYLIHPKADIPGAIPYLRRMRGLNSVTILASTPEEIKAQVRYALPNCELHLTP